MKRLENTFNTFLDNSFNNYISKISSEYNLPSNELVSLLKEVSLKQFKLFHNLKMEKIESLKKNKLVIDKCCQYIMTKGLSKNKQCSKRVSVESVTGDYCTIHLKQEQTFTVLMRENNKKIINDLNKKKPCLMLNLNEHGNLIHESTGFVFDPYTKKVIGKQVKNQVLILTKEDIELCKVMFVEVEIPETIREEDDEADIKDDSDKDISEEDSIAESSEDEQND